MGMTYDASVASWMTSGSTDIETKIARIQRKISDLTKKEFHIDEEEKTLMYMLERDKSSQI